MKKDKINYATNELYEALKESLILQSHYASLLNQYDGGERKGFDSPEKWIGRLREMKAEWTKRLRELKTRRQNEKR